MTVLWFYMSKKKKNYNAVHLESFENRNSNFCPVVLGSQLLSAPLRTQS